MKQAYNNGKKRATTGIEATPLLERVRQLNWSKKIISGCRSNVSQLNKNALSSIPQVWIDHVHYGLEQLERVLKEDYEEFKRANPAKKRSYKK